jgi:hypothetical protein
MSSTRGKGNAERNERAGAVPFDENETVAYTGDGLADLLASQAGMQPASEPPFDPGSTGASLTPVAYCLSGPVAAANPPAPAEAPQPSSARTSMMALAVLFALLVGVSVSAEQRYSASRVSPGGERHEAATDKTAVVVVTRAKAPPKARRKAPAFVIRRATTVPVAPLTVVPTRTDEASADEQLIKAAQLERPL